MRKLIVATIVASIAVSTSYLTGTASAASDGLAVAIALSADGGRYDLAKLDGIRDRMVAIGVSEDNANSVLKRFITDGVEPTDIETLALASVAYATATDRSVISLGRDFSRAFFSGRVDMIRELDVKLNFLTADDYKAMLRLEKEGKFRQAKDVAVSSLASRVTKLAGN